MEKRREAFERSEYYGCAAIYQPDQGQLRRTLSLVLLLLGVLLVGLATQAHAAGQPASCQVLTVSR